MTKATIKIEIKREKNTVRMSTTCSSKRVADKMQALFERLIDQLQELSS